MFLCFSKFSLSGRIMWVHWAVFKHSIVSTAWKKLLQLCYNMLTVQVIQVNSDFYFHKMHTFTGLCVLHLQVGSTFKRGS